MKKGKVLEDLGDRTRLRVERNQADRRLRSQLRKVNDYLGDSPKGDPVVFFNASTRIHHLSLNAGFAMVAAWAVRLGGVPVVQLVCRAGMLQCMLGTDRGHPEAGPPCRSCVRLSDQLYEAPSVIALRLQSETVTSLRAQLAALPLSHLADWETDGLPAGRLCLPTLRWALRRHNLEETPATEELMRKYLLSAVSLSSEIESALRQVQARALVVFNGITYPEAVARHVAERIGIPVITHEVGLRPLSGFFSHGEATFREVDVPAGASLDPEDGRALDEYLAARQEGNFTMAGVRFWTGMARVPQRLEELVRSHHQTVSVFTNVIFDTSQVHANTLFMGMFEWLEVVGDAAARHPETLFILRAHPDEDRPGKESRESVSEWVQERRLEERPNVLFFGPQDPISSYELIHRSKLVLVYNSSIGLEASIAGAPVLCAGRARYTQLPTVFLPRDRQAYLDTLETMLNADRIEVPKEYAANARTFLFYELYRASIDFGRYLAEYPQLPGFVTLAEFQPADALRPDVIEIELLQEGILRAKPFLYARAMPAHASAGSAAAP